MVNDRWVHIGGQSIKCPSERALEIAAAISSTDNGLGIERVRNANPRREIVVIRIIKMGKRLARADLLAAGDMAPAPDVRREGRALLYGFTEYYLERRMRSFALLTR